MTAPDPLLARDPLDGSTRLLAPVRNRYFYGQMLSAPALERDQVFFRQNQQLLARNLGGYGVLQGLEVTIEDRTKAQRGDHLLKVEPGVAIAPSGRLIVVPARPPDDGRPRLDGQGCRSLSLSHDAIAQELQKRKSASPKLPAEYTLAVVLRERSTPWEEAPVLAGDCGTARTFEVSAFLDDYTLAVVEAGPDRTSFVPAGDDLNPFALEPAPDAATQRDDRITELLKSPREPDAIELARLTIREDPSGPASARLQSGETVRFTIRVEPSPAARSRLLSAADTRRLFLETGAALDSTLRRRRIGIVAEASGNGQSIEAGNPLKEPLCVVVTNAFGKPVKDVSIEARITGGGGSLTAADASRAAIAPAASDVTLLVTDSDGRAKAYWTLGKTPGLNTAEFVVPTERGYLALGSASFVAWGLPRVRNLVVQQGLVRSATAGEEIAVDVDLRDALGAPAGGEAIRFRVVLGNGRLASQGVSLQADGALSVTTSLQGRATVRWTLDSAAGPNAIEVSRPSDDGVVSAPVVLLAWGIAPAAPPPVPTSPTDPVSEPGGPYKEPDPGQAGPSEPNPVVSVPGGMARVTQVEPWGKLEGRAAASWADQPTIRVAFDRCMDIDALCQPGSWLRVLKVSRGRVLPSDMISQAGWSRVFTVVSTGDDPDNVVPVDAMGLRLEARVDPDGTWAEYLLTTVDGSPVYGDEEGIRLVVLMRAGLGAPRSNQGERLALGYAGTRLTEPQVHELWEAATSGTPRELSVVWDALDPRLEAPRPGLGPWFHAAMDVDERTESDTKEETRS